MCTAPPGVAVEVQEVKVVGDDSSPVMMREVSESSVAEMATPGMTALMLEKVQEVMVVVVVVGGEVEVEEGLSRSRGCVTVTRSSSVEETVMQVSVSDPK